MSVINLAWRLNPAQERAMKVLDSGAYKILSVIAGRKWGKSSFGARGFLKLFYGPRQCMPPLGVAMAPNYPMSIVIERKFAEIAAPLIKKHYKADRAYILEPTEASRPFPLRIEIKSADNPGGTRGISPGAVWGDEPAEWFNGADTFDVLLATTIDTLAPLIFTGTPKGYCWVHERFCLQCQEKNPASDTYVFRGRTEDNCREHCGGFLAHSEIERIRAKFSDNYAAQELEGECVSFEGLVFKSYSDQKHGHYKIPPGTNIVRKIAGLDFGFTDPFAAVQLAKLDTGKWVILKELYGAELSMDYWGAELKLWRDRDGVQAFYADPEDKTARQWLSRIGIETMTARKDVTTGIQYVYNLFEKDRLYIAEGECPMTRNELGRYQWNKEKKPPQPLHAWCHAMDALRYGAFTEYMMFDYATDGEPKPAPREHPTDRPRVYSADELSHYARSFQKYNKVRQGSAWPDWYVRN
ncbi:hypothetical protein [Glutamicibacter sp.]|uniref:hypothetical protein n=1 Tax=Glutamicibacter sp. TaxID=1931995 RepID=UPI002FDB40FC